MHRLELAIILAGLLGLAATLSRADDRLDAIIPSLTVTFTRGSVTRLEANGETLAAAGGGSGLSGIVRATGFVEAGSGRGSTAAIEPGMKSRREFAPSGGGRGAAFVELVAADPGGLTVQLDARWPAGGLAGVQWAIDAVPDQYAILVPGDGGVRLDATSPIANLAFDYPRSWEAPFVIIEGKRGGLLVRAAAVDRFLRFEARRGRAGWTLSFTALEQAPFSRNTRVTPLAWRIEPFEGSAQAAVQSYRTRFVEPARTAQPPPPAWTREIRAVVLVPPDASVLDPVAGYVDPSKTLLYVAAWRRAGYDHSYPDYSGIDGLEQFVLNAHARGFRVMAHVNHFGCDPTNPDCAPFLGATVVDPWTHQALGFRSATDPKANYLYVDPASRAWRRLLVDRVRQAVERYGFDAVHLDQLTLVFDDDRGPIDGSSMIEGNRSLLRELREALPSIALGGEEVTDVAAPYLSFAQKAAHGVVPAERTWRRGVVASIDPIEADLFGDLVRPYAHPTCIDPEVDPPYSQCLEVARRHEALPTIRVDAAILKASAAALQEFSQVARGAARAPLGVRAPNPEVVVRIVDALKDATSGTALDDGTSSSYKGPLWPGEDGAEFYPSDDVVMAHPPYRAVRLDPASHAARRDGTGRAFATVQVSVPATAGAVAFRSMVAVDPGAVGPGKTDGVLFEVEAEAEGIAPASATALNSDGKPMALDLDLSPMRGKTVRLRLSVDPGPKRNPAYDWARWFDPRVEAVPEGGAH